MAEWNSIFWTVDMPALMTCALLGVSCGLTGSLLVLRQQAMTVDALSHVMLPGLVILFLLTGTLSSAGVMLAASVASLVALGFVSLFSRYTDNSAVLGIVLTGAFALGIVMLEVGAGSRVHIDTHHALYGSLELSYWPEAPSLRTIPDNLRILGATSILVFSFVSFFYEDLKILCFDQDFLKARSPARYHSIVLLLMVLVSFQTAAAFKVTGAVLTVFLFVGPAVTARMLTNRFQTQLLLSAAFGILYAILGYILAALVPALLGYSHSLSAAGVIAVVGGLGFFLALVLGPIHGIGRK